MISYSRNLTSLLLQIINGASTGKCNQKGLLPVHCASLQGRQDAIQAILQSGIKEIESINKHTLEWGTPSLPYLALANGHLECTKWYEISIHVYKQAVRCIN